MGYKEEYQHGLPHLNKEINLVIDAVSKRESICLTGMYKSGIHRIIDYFVNTYENKNIKIYYDKVGDLRINNLPIYTDIILIIPDYNKKSKSFKSAFEKFCIQYKDQIVSITSVSPDILENHRLHFSTIISPISFLHIIKPRTMEETHNLIQSRIRINNWNIPRFAFNEIYILSGGNPGLIKHVCSYYDKHRNLDTEGLVKDIAIKDVLENLQREIETNQLETLISIGLLNEKEKIFSRLLEIYIEKNQPLSLMKLNPIQQKLLELFNSKLDQLVTFNEIDSCLYKYQTFSLWGRYKAITRFQTAIRNEFVLINVKGKGYILKKKNNI